MKLYGSITSPFVRRVRYTALELGHSFELIDSLTDAGQVEVRKRNPIWKVPCVEIDELLIWDSHTIIDYLHSKYPNHPHALRQPTGLEIWRERNLVTAADGCVESAINVFYLRKEGVQVNEVPYLKKQQDRVKSILTWLKSQLHGNYFTTEKKLGLSELTFYCILDWLRFREQYAVLEDETLKGFLDFHSLNKSLVATKLPG